MKEIIFNEFEKINIKIGSKEYLVRKPTIGDQRKLQSDIVEAEKGDGNVLEAMIKWGVAIGLPEDVILELPVDAFRKIVEVLSEVDEKKKQ